MSSRDDASTTADPPVDRRATFNRLLPAQHRMRWGAGVVLVIAGAAGIVANLLLPILSFSLPGGSVTQDWSDLRNPGGLAYEQRLLVWPLFAYSLVALLGGLLSASTYAGEVGKRRLRPLVPAGLAIVAFAGLLLLLTATRWLGFTLARQADLGESLVRLHAVPYVNLGAGLLLAGSASWLLVRPLGGDARTRWAAASAGVAGLGLVVLPLLPFAYSMVQGTTIRLDEFSLAAMAADGSAWEAPAVLGWARLALWGGLLLGVVSVLAHRLRGDGVLPRRMHWLCRAVDAGIAVVAAGVVLVVRFYQRLPHVGSDVTVGPNFILPLALIALGVFWWLHLRGNRRGRGAGTGPASS